MGASRPLGIALVGVGEVARNGHLPVLEARPDMRLVATVSHAGQVSGVPAFATLAEAFRAEPGIDAVILCTPPRSRYALAREALLAGRHVLLEKPPATSLAQVGILERLAKERGLALFASWHSRFTPGIETARAWLADKTVERVRLEWRENLRRWHPGQDWLFEPGGMGVLEMGINALSIATRILPRPFSLVDAVLVVPSNRQAPIAASMNFVDDNDAPVAVEFDNLQDDRDTWIIDVETSEGLLQLPDRGFQLVIDGEEQPLETRDTTLALSTEYVRLYDRFAALVAAGERDVDTTPLVHVADTFLLAEYRQGSPFYW